MTTMTITAWLLTYLLHSTIFLGVALAVSHIMNGRQLALQESLLRTALIGGLLTASLQLAFGIAPVTGALALEDGPAVKSLGWVPIAQSEERGALPGEGVASPIVGTWAIILLATWALGSLMALFGVLRSALDLRRLMLNRCFRPAGRLVESLAAAMGLRRPVRLSTSKAVAVPFATGIRQPEICCPERVSDLAREHQTGLFAHEMAHLARRDPAWQLAYRLGEALLVLQPLNRLARRRLEEIAEHLTDERAAACTGDRLGLARCLVVVAHWGHSSRTGLPATAFAAGPRLDRRVRRLLSGTADLCISRRWTVPIGFAFLFGSVALLPTIGPKPVHAESNTLRVAQTTIWSASAEESGSGSEANGAKTWSVIDERPADAAPPAEPPAAPPPSTPPATPKSASAPKTSPAPEAPPAAPISESPAASPAAPAPAAVPEQVAKPEHGVQPAPAAPPARTNTPAEVARRREAARRQARENSTQRARIQEEQRARAEAKAREHREISREQADRIRETAREEARRHRLSETQIEQKRFQASEIEAEARRMVREEAAACRERARALNDEARALAREAAGSLEITEVQREELQRQAIEMRAQAELVHQESAQALREQARVLAEEARILAEQAEAERRRQEEENR